ncbi:hypothetical protein [Mycolicibacterium farcinogenes]|uniref:Uncharacterized protein n=1 Tax=Mycolicibacterium farcinogenes TaxID=1802 RepID=A0ACD1F9S7_MYCFR|nr:hypothetical protein [Mycolicibacterium farcinogenes]QZH63812.1 hypothetical protein K6L26_17170 [Mycolicibacterium farcinogenes]
MITISQPDGTNIELTRRHDGVITISRVIAGWSVHIDLDPVIAQCLIDHVQDLLEGQYEQ